MALQAQPIDVCVQQGKGYVWNAAGAKRLRQEYRIMGAMLGSISQFKNQVSVNGLPLELMQEEVALLLEQGAVRLLSCKQAERASGPAPVAAASRAQQEELQYFVCDDEDEDEDTNNVSHSMAMHGGEPGLAGAQAAAHACSTAATEWKTALKDGTAFEVPISSEGHHTHSSLEWTYPATHEERLHFRVFKDLHQKGCFLTGGAKFGADYLAYPGDPALYHAQFTVRVLSVSAAVLPCLLASWARASHAARKHLLLASCEEGEAGSLGCTVYVTIGPQGGFGN